MKLIPTLLAFALVTFTSLATADEVKHVKSKEAAAIVAKGDVIVLDVRTPDEYSEGHIEGAKNIDFLDDAKFKAEAAKLDKTKTYLVHCQAGGRSTKSLKTLQELGINNLIHLDDGFGGWSDNKLPVKK
jgi:rhodanese-related sulfurtransferase